MTNPGPLPASIGQAWGSARFCCAEVCCARLLDQSFHACPDPADSRGKDVATVLMQMRSGATVTCKLSYANCGEQDRFPETFGYVEGSEGLVELGPDFWIRTTTREGTASHCHPPPFYSWADPRHAVEHSSIVDFQRNLLHQLSSQGPTAATGKDNLKTVRLGNARLPHQTPEKCLTRRRCWTKPPRITRHSELASRNLD